MVKNFYRPATENDFEMAFMSNDLPPEAKELIRKNEFLGAVTYLCEKHGYAKGHASRQCREYLMVLVAKTDFKNGKPVFTNY